MKNSKLFKKILTGVLIIVVTLIVIILLYKSNPLKMSAGEIFSSHENLQFFIKGYGKLAPFIFVLIQALQVIVAPVPGNVTALAGGALFGFINGSLLSTIGLIIGSTIAFALARLFGRTLVERLVKKEIIDKYIDTLSGKYTIMLFLLFLIPFFPDDALCFIAGLTSISYPVFIVIVILTRPPGMIFSSLVGSGAFKPEWWVWTIIGIISAVFIYCIFKYNKEIEDWLLKKIKKEK
jgi:uncharacterized membrane protein YdjX (TVP38/TMEM64 family)